MKKKLSAYLIVITSLVNANILIAQETDSLKEAIVLELIRLAKIEYDKIEDYESIIVTTEYKGKRKRKTEYVKTKYLHPNNIYLKWLPGPYVGLQASYVPGRDKKNYFLAKETGIMGIIGVKKWKNDDPIINLLYPHHFTIQETNLGYMFEIVQLILKKGKNSGSFCVANINETIDKATNKPVTAVVINLQKASKNELKWSKVELFFDKKTKLPLHFILYEKNGYKTGDYAFTKFRTNIGLSLNDFDLK